MKKTYLITAALSASLIVSVNTSLKAQAFQRGSLLVSVSEGSTWANYKTTVTGGSTSTGTTTGSYRSVQTDGSPAPALGHEHCTPGTRDPFIIEYGITNRIGIGVTMGNDIFTVNPSDFYGFQLDGNHTVKAKTSEFTFDSNYHFYVNKRLDLSVVGSFGMFSVAYSGKQVSDGPAYSYTANGGILRGGVRARYYFYKHFGAFGMISTYTGNASPKDVKGNTVATNYSTKITGQAVEVGLCYRFIR